MSAKSAANPEIEGSAVILSAERTAPGIAPLESLGLPSLLDGSQGRNRGPEEKSALDASNDLEAIHAWLASRASNPNTRSAYQKEAERFLLWCIMEKNTALSSVTVPQASQYLRWLEDLARLTPEAWSRKWRVPAAQWIGKKSERRDSPAWRPFNGPLSHTSRRQALTVVRLLFSFLTKTGYLRTNPFDQVPQRIRFLPGEGAPKEFSDRSLTPEQWGDVLRCLDAMEDGIEKSRLETILMMGKGLGMRASEMLSSTAGWITQRRIGNESVTIIEVIGKGDKVRRLPLQQEHLDAFNAYLKIRGLPPIGSCPKGTPLLASLGKGKRPKNATDALSRSGLHRILKKFLEEQKNPIDGAKLRTASAHWLRHTFAETALESMPVNVVQTALGHSSLSTTSLYLVPADARVIQEFKKVKPI